MDKGSYQDNSFLNIKSLNFVIVLSGLVVLYAFLSIYYLPPGNAVARVHDYLDCIFSVYKVRAELSGFFLDYDCKVQQIFNGVPLNVTGLGDFNVGANMYLLFDPFNAYVINQFLFKTIGFIGLLLLLKDHVLPKGSYYLVIAVCTALAFGLLNHMPTRFGTILYQPLLYWAFLNIYISRRRFIDIIIVLFYPIMTGSVVRGGFVVILLLVIGAIYCWVNKNRNRKLILFTTVGCLFISAIVESRLFYQYVLISFDSARNMILPGQTYPFTLSKVFELFIRHFVKDGYSHHIQGQWPFMFWVVILGIGVVLYRLKTPLKDMKHHDIHKKLARIYVVLFVVSVFISLLYGSSCYITGLIWQLSHINFKFSRISAISPILWHTMFALAVSILIVNYRGFVHKKLVPVILFIIVAYPAQQQLYSVKQKINEVLGFSKDIPLRASLRNYLVGTPIDAELLHRSGAPPYVPLKEFFRETTFASISRDISKIINRPKSSYRVMSFELSPSILQFNGFYTLDSSMGDESLEYAKEFTHLFRHELAKDGKRNHLLRRKLYAYVARESRKHNGITPTFDVCQFVKMGGKFIFSSKPLLNASELHLSLLKSYRNLKPTAIGRSRHEMYDSIYLYQINVPLECSINGKTLCDSLKTG